MFLCHVEMAKNVKADAYKSDEVVVLSNIECQDGAEKRSLNSARRGFTARPGNSFVTQQITASHFTKAEIIPNSITSQISTISSPRVITPIKCQVRASVVSSSSPAVPRQIRATSTRTLASNVNKKTEQQTISLINTKSSPFAACISKDTSVISRNGQIIKKVNTGIGASIPSDLTITPIDDCKPKGTISSTVLPLSKIADMKDKELSTGVTPNTSTFQKGAFFPKQTVKSVNSDSSYCPNVSKVILLSDGQHPTPQPAPTRGRPRGSKNKVVEPVCLTLSSDDEDAGNEELSQESNQNSVPVASSKMLQSQYSLRNNSSLPSVNNSQANNGAKVEVISFEKPNQLPMAMERDEVEDEDIDEAMAEDEEIEDEEEAMETSLHELSSSSDPLRDSLLVSEKSEKQVTIMCRSVRVGSYKIHPLEDKQHIYIHTSAKGFMFSVPTLRNGGRVTNMVTVMLTEQDCQQVIGFFGRCLPILFIFTTPVCGERIRNQLHMLQGGYQYFDPDGEDDRQKIITFLIDTISDEVKNFLRNCFPGEGILKEVDQKLANEILVKSTPQQQTVSQNIVTRAPPNTFTQITTAAPVIQNPTPPTTTVVQCAPVKPPILVTQSPQVKKILTYPPPPQTGGIAITSEDLACLDEGEFLNDAIIDFYLKYLMNEKFSEKDRKRTHIFSSFFYPRLTQRNTKFKLSDDSSSNGISSSMAVRRHAQVKTWTKNVDIFEKDFIIIPINQNVHWFLAIICFPGLVPDTPPSPERNSKTFDSVTSSNDSDLSESPEMNQACGQSDSLSINSTKDQSCSTEDQDGSDDGGFSNDVESTFAEEPIPDAPDSSTHPDRNAHHEKMPCILIFDSLSGPNRWRIVNNLREYLEVEWKVRKKTERSFSKNTIRGHVTSVPQQTNFSDCGIYVLQYVESFFENPFPYFADHMPSLPDWFPPEKVSNKRKEIQNLISKLKERQLPSTSCSKKEAEKPSAIPSSSSSSS